MRFAAWVLIILSGLACAWWLAVANMLIRPGIGDLVLHDSYYGAAAARNSLHAAFLALANGIGALLLHRKRRPGALWIVLGAGVLALATAFWHYAALMPDFGRRVPDYAETYRVSVQARAFFRWLLDWTALGFTLVGWIVWLVNRRIASGHQRD